MSPIIALLHPVRRSVVVLLALVGTLLMVRLAAASGEQLRGDLFGWGPGISMSSNLGGSYLAVSGQQTSATATGSLFKFFKDTNQWYGNGSSVTIGQIATGFTTSGGNSSFNHVQNSYYAAKWNGNDKGVIFRLSGALVTISGVSRTPTSPTSSDTVAVTLTTAATPPAEQTFFLRYTTNNFSTSTVVQMTGSGTSRAATIPAQSASTNVIYYVFSSANTTSIAAADADLMTIYYDTNGGSNYNYTVTAPPSPITVTAAKALWLDTNTIAWNGVAGASYKLLYDSDGGIMSSAESTACVFPSPAGPCYVALTSSGTVSGYPKNPNATGLTKLLTGLSADNAKYLLKGQVVVASYNSGGTRLDATNVQIQSVLDNLYVDNGTASSAVLGVTYSASAPTVRLWAPTAKSVTLRKFADSTTTTYTSHSMTLDAASGVWSVSGDGSWNRLFYLFDVQVYVPSLDQVVNNLVTDPYAITLSADTSNTADPRSQFVNLADADLKPSGWDSLSKPALAAPEDIVIYEMHVRDFSINDSTVNSTDRGTFMAFTYDGAGPDANTTLSDGMKHVLALKDAGLTHVHLLPAFDIASVPENSVPRTVSPSPTGFARNAQDQQSAVNAARATDGFNWGYDPYHYGAPEGSYSTDPNGVQRIVEFRRMVSALNQNGLRVVMDVVYNHTAAKGQEDKSVLDKVVPGYYYRYDTNGTLYETSCCADTASEYAMFEKLMIDTLKRWAQEYKVDSFRFDLMNLHTRQNMLNVKTALTPIDSTIYLYGEGWDFGSASGNQVSETPVRYGKGLTTCPNCYAKQGNMTGQGIGLFNDKIRDAAHGGFSTDPLQIRKQGFINGLHYDWNAYCYANRAKSDLDAATDVLRSSLRASGTDWNGQGSPFTDDPSESVPYVEKHDNETLFDQNVFKLPNGAGDPGVCSSSYVPPVTSMAERVRAQNMGLSLTGLAQGVPFFQMGSDILRSKSLDRNSYDSSDWFNRVDWSYTDSTYSNNFGQGLPPSGDNSTRWSIMGPLLNNTALDPGASDAQAGAAHLREILRIRKSSPLFRLRSESDINARVTYFNTGNNPDALLIMGLDDGNLATDLDASYEYIMVLFNANKVQHSFTIAETAGMAFTLHPLQADGVDADAVVQSATFNNSSGQFTIPARTTAVFVSTQPYLPPSTLDEVVRLYPRGGVANQVDQGAFAPSGFDIYVQVKDLGVTNFAGQGAGIQCYVHWGKYGQSWSDLAMTYNGDKLGNVNDEYKATIPQSTINGLTPGTYGFTAYCQRAGEGKKWKQDLYDIDSVATDDDQGDGLITVVPTADSSLQPAGGVFVHLFEWKWADIEKECTFLAQKGYTAVQVSPPNEHLVATVDQAGQPASDYPWWVRYQPVSHDTTKLTSRSGSLAEFQSMVTTCNSKGVGIYVDAVINHTADVEVGSPPAGTFGTQYDANPATGRFYGSQYQSDDFHADCTISSYGDRNQVQRCKLSSLPDLDTGKADVQTELRNYLQSLINMGVKGFRIDGAKHMAAQDIAAILNGLTGSFYVFQEAIDVDSSERVRDWEYTPNGDVTEFAWSQAMANKFNGCSGTLSDLSTLPYGDMMPTRFAQVFVDNHDNQRGHGPGGSCIVDHRDGKTHVLANIFTLAYPYGHPSVMSSYYWSTDPNSNAGDSLGPPTVNGGPGSDGATLPVYGSGQVAGDTPANCAGTYPASVINGDLGKWVCEHRNIAIANMVAFRKITDGQAVSNWVNVSANHIAFGRGSKGYVAINRSGSAATTTYQTSMAAGVYCDITKGELTADGTACTGPTITVNGSGQIVNQTVNSLDAFAIDSAALVGAAAIEALPAAPAIVTNGSTAINATLRTQAGAPVVGRTVSFALTSGLGALSSITATTNAAGVATVTYNAPASVTIAQLQASYTAASTTVYSDPAYVFVATSSAAVTTTVASSNPTTFGSLATYDVQIVKNGAGSPTIGVAKLADNPCPNSAATAKGAVSAFVDVLLERVANVDGVEITIKYSNETDEANHTIYWCINGNWVEVSGGPITRDTTANTVKFTVTSSTTPTLSQLEGTPFVVAGTDGSTLPVTISWFQATRSGDQLHIAWTTATESANLGFHLYAEQAGVRRRVNSQLIASQVVDSFEPQEYSFDAASVGGDIFYIEDVGVTGRSRLHGPFSLGQEYGARAVGEAVDWQAILAEHEAKATSRAAAATAQVQSALAQLTVVDAASVVDAGSDSTALEAQIDFIDDDPDAPGANGNRVFLPLIVGSNQAEVTSAAATPVVDLRVERSGIHRVTYEELRAAGFDLAGVRSRSLALISQGQPVPIYMVSATSFGPGAYFDFYGQALDTLYTKTNVYTLRVDGKLALRGGLSVPVPNLALKLPAAYPETVVVNQDRDYSFAAPNGDPWLDQYILAYRSPSAANSMIMLENIVAGAGPITLTVGLWGSTDWPQTPDHHVVVAFNGTTIADRLFDGIAAPAISAPLSPNLLREGANTLTVTLPGDSGVDYDLVALDRYSVTYPRAFVARNGSLTFTVTAPLLRVNGLPSDKVAVYYLRDGKFARLRNVVTAATATGYSATFAGARKVSTTYFVYAEDAMLKPKIAAARPKVDITSGQANYLVITHPDFASDLRPLVNARKAQGFVVRTVDVNDIYAQFSFGVFDPQAIRSYIKHAITKMGVKYILLVGGDTYDYTNNIGLAAYSFIPSLYAATGDIVQFAPVDPLYTDINLDGAPDAAIGRFPVRSSAELQSVIAKTLAFDVRSDRRSALFAADAFDGVSYKAHSDVFASSLGEGWQVQRAYLDDAGVTNARTTLLNALNQGPALASFIGHSEPTTWTFQGLFSASDAAALTNAGRPMVVLQYGCWNTYYVASRFNTLGHKLMLSGDRGAAVVLGAATLTAFESERLLGELFTPRLVQPGVSIGAALQAAKQELAATHPDLADVLLGWTLLGDPSLVLQR